MCVCGRSVSVCGGLKEKIIEELHFSVQPRIFCRHENYPLYGT